VNTPGLRDGKTPHETALLAGHRSIANFLEQHGARATELTPEERFSAARVAGERATVEALLAADPGLVARLGPTRQTELVARAVAARRLDSISSSAPTRTSGTASSTPPPSAGPSTAARRTSSPGCVP